MYCVVYRKYLMIKCSIYNFSYSRVMAKLLLVRHNVCVEDQSSYFTSLWSGEQEASFSSSQAKGWMTDMEMVGDTDTGQGSAMVHRAVILPLCPYLAMMSQVSS